LLCRMNSIVGRNVLSCCQRYSTNIDSVIAFRFNIENIDHNIAVLTFKVVLTSKLSYLAELVSTQTPARELRTSSRRPNQLHVPNVRTAFES